MEEGGESMCESLVTLVRNHCAAPVLKQLYQSPIVVLDKMRMKSMFEQNSVVSIVFCSQFNCRRVPFKVGARVVAVASRVDKTITR